jgi:hypothetical protein
MGRSTSYATVFASRALCASGCGRRTNGNLICSECSKTDSHDLELRRQGERLMELRRLAISGAPAKGTCLSCLNWSNRCLMEIPEVSVTFAPSCSCYLSAKSR